MTGPDLVRRVEQAAARRGVSPYRLMRPLAKNPTAWLETMRATKRPKPQTVARVEEALRA
jgi:hypothetical protein